LSYRHLCSRRSCLSSVAAAAAVTASNVGAKLPAAKSTRREAGVAKYAATGGWGFAQFNDGKPVHAAGLSGCFACHVPVKARDFIFTKYAP